MNVLPNTKREWVELLLIPFMVYVLAMPIWLCVWRVAADSFLTRDMWHYERFIFGRWYYLCLVVFCISGAIQWRCGWRRAALVSFLFAVATIIILFSYLLPLNESK